MRIIFDDTQLKSFIYLVKSVMEEYFRTKEQMSSLTKWSYGMDRVESSLVKKRLNDVFSDAGFEIGNDVYYENGIGNNKRYPVYYNAPNEKQQVGYINLINNMYGKVYVYVTDYNQARVSPSYHLSRLGYSFD